VVNDKDLLMGHRQPTILTIEKEMFDQLDSNKEARLA